MNKCFRVQIIIALSVCAVACGPIGQINSASGVKFESSNLSPSLPAPDNNNTGGTNNSTGTSDPGTGSDVLNDLNQLAPNLKQCVSTFLATNISAQFSNILSSLSFHGLLSPSVTISNTQSCSGGGAISVYGQAGINLGIGFPHEGIGTDNASAAITYASCNISTNCGFTINLDGTVAISGISQYIDFNIFNGDFNGQGYATIAANPLRIGINGHSLPLTFSILNALNETGTASISPLGATGTAIIAVQGTIWGFPVNFSITRPFNLVY